MKKLRIGVIGTGRIGRLHANNLVSSVKDADVVAVSDMNLPAAGEVAEALQIPACYADYHEILNDPTIDAVFICSSTDTHSVISMEAARAGKHIFCEKPIDHDLDKIREVLKTVKEAGVLYQVGFNRRFDRNFKHIHEVVADGGVGEVQIVKVTSRDPEAPPISYVKVSGGIFVDMTIHDFDMMRYLSGSEVTEVSAVGACLVNPEIAEAGDVDTCIITLRFANGALGVIDNSRQAVYGYDQRVEVFRFKGHDQRGKRDAEQHDLLHRLRRYQREAAVFLSGALQRGVYQRGTRICRCLPEREAAPGRRDGWLAAGPDRSCGQKIL